MAQYWWDANGATGGTGGTGAWDIGGSLWRAGSSTGTLSIWPNTNPSTHEAILEGTAGTLTINSGLLVYANIVTTNSVAFTIAGGTAASRLVLNGTTPTLATNSQLTISALITNSSGVIKTGTNTLILSGANTTDFTGGITVRQGVLQLSTSASAAGTGAITLGNTTGSDTATLQVATTALTYANAIVLATGTTGVLTVRNTGSAISTTFSGGVTGTNNLRIESNATTGTVTFTTAAINNSGSITVGGAGTGLVTISGGVGSNVTLIDHSTATAGLTIGTTALTVNSAGTTLRRTAITSTLTVSGGISGTGNLVLENNAASGSITLSTTAINNVGTITNQGTAAGGVTISANIGSSVTTVTQNSTTSALTLSGTNTFTGSLTIAAGVVNLTLAASASSSTIVMSGTSIPNSSYLYAANGITVANNFSAPSVEGRVYVYRASGTTANIFSGTLSGSTSAAYYVGSLGSTGTVTYSGQMDVWAVATDGTGVGTGAITLSGGSTTKVQYIEHTNTAPLTVSTGTLQIAAGQYLYITKYSTGTLTFSAPTSGSGNLSLQHNTAAGGSYTVSSAFGHTGTLEIYGGTGPITVSSIIPATLAGGVFISGGGAVTLSGVNTFTSGLTVFADGIAYITTTASAVGAGNINLNTIATPSINSTLAIRTTALTIARPVVLTGAGISYLENSGGNVTVTWTGGVTGTGNVAYNHAGGTGTVTISTAAIANTGTVTFQGAGTGAVTVSAGISGTVTDVIFSGSAAVTISTTATTVTTSKRFYRTSGASVTHSAATTGTGTLYVDDGGTAGSMTFSGGLGHTGAFSTVSGGGNGSTGITISGAIGATVNALNHSSNTPLYLSNANPSFTAPITLYGYSTLFLNNATALGSGTVYFNGSIPSLTLNVTGMTLSNPAVLQSGIGQIYVGSGGTTSATFTGGVTGTGSTFDFVQDATGTLTVSIGDINPTSAVRAQGTATGRGVTISAAIKTNVTSVQNVSADPLYLSGANTYTGTTYLYGATIQTSSSASLGNGGNIYFSGGILRWTGHTTDYSSRFTNSGSASYRLDVDSGLTVTLASNLSGTNNGLEKLGAGTLVLAGSNTYSVFNTVTLGTLRMGSSGALGPTTNYVTLAATGTLSLDINGYSPTVAQIAGGSSAATIALGSGTLTFGDSGSNTLAAVITGTGSVVKQGTGQQTFSGASTFTGGLTVAAGTVVFNVSNATTVSGAFGPSASTVTLGGASSSAASILGNTFTLSNPISLNASSTGTLTIGNVGTTVAPTFSGPIALNGENLTIALSGTTGNMTVSGTISGTGNLTIANTKTTSGIATVSAIANTGTVTVTQSSATTVQQAALTYTGTGTTSYSQNITGFVTAAVSGAGVFPPSRIVLKGRLQETNSTAGTVTLGDTTGAYDAEFQSSGTPSSVSLAVTVPSGNSGKAILSNTSVSQIAASSVAISKDLYIANRATGAFGSFFRGTVTGTGNIYVDSLVASSNSVNYFTNASFTNTGSFNFIGTTADATLISVLDSANILSNSITNLTVNVSGEVQISSDQSFTGNVTVTAGTLTVFSATSIGPDSVGKTITVSSGGTLTAAQGSAAFSYTNATLNLNGTGAASSNGGNTGGALQILPDDILTFTGKIVLQSASTIGAVFSPGTATMASGTTINNGGFLLTFNTPAASTSSIALDGVISGTGGLTKIGTQTLTLRGNNSYTGVTTLSAGTISVPTLTAASTNGPLGAATGVAANIVFSGASTLEYTGADVTWARNLTINAAITATISVAAGTTLTWTGTNTATTGILNKAGLGTLKLPTSLLHTGGTTATAGTLDLTAAASIGSSASRLTWNGGTVANSSGSTITLTSNPITFTAATVYYSGPNDLVLSGVPANLGGSKTFDISAGKLTVGGVINDGTSTFGITKTGAGTLSLTSTANTYTGATTLSAGTLEISNLANGGVASSLGNASNAAANLVFAGGTFKLTPSPSGNATDRSFTLTGDTTFDNGGGLYFDGLNNVVTGTPTLTLTGSSSGRITGWATQNSASFVKEGTGSWGLNSAHTGTTTINAGLLWFYASPPTITVNGGSFSVLNVYVALTSNITVNGSFGNEPVSSGSSLTYSGTVTLTVSPTITVSTPYASAYTAVFSGVVSGSGLGFTKAGVSTLSLTNTGNTFDGAITVNQGYLSGAAGTLGPSSATTGITVNTGGSLTLTDLSSTAFASRDLTLTGTGVAGEGALNLTQTTTGTQTFNSITLGGNATIQFATAASTAVELATTSGSISLGANTLVLKTDSAPSLTISSAVSGTGGSLVLGLGTTTLSSLTNSYTGSTIIPSTATLTLSGLLGSGSYAGTIVNDGTLNLTTSSSQTLSGPIYGTGALTRSSGSTSYITGTSNNYTGKTTLNGNLYVKTLANLSIPSSLGAPTNSTSGQIDINNAFLYYDGTTNSVTDRNIYLSGATTLGGALSVTNSGSVTYNGTVTMADVGAKTLTLTSAVGVAGSGTLNGVLSNAATAANTLSLSKSGTAKWTLGGNSTFTGAVTHSAGPLELTHNNALGTSLTTKAYTQSNNAQLVLTGGRTLASTINLSLRGTVTTNGDTYVSPIEVGGGLATITGLVSTNSVNAIIIPSDDLTITGQITAANEIYFGSALGKTTTVSGGSTAVAQTWGSYGEAGTVIFAGSHLRSSTFYVRNGGTTRLNVASAAPLLSTSISVSNGGTGTGGFYRTAYANGTLVWDNVGATAATTVTHAVLTSNLTVQTLKIVRTAAFDTKVTINSGTFSSGVVIFDNSALGTLSATNGIFVLTTTGGGVQAGGYIYDNNGAFMAAYRHASGYMTYPVYGTTTGFVSQDASSSGFATNNYSYNLSAAVTGIGTSGATSVSSVRLANSSASITLGTGGYLAASSLIDAAGASTARTAVSGGIVRAQSTVTHIYTDNTDVVSGMTVSSKLYPALGTNSTSGVLTKFGTGLLTTTEMVKYASGISHIQGDWNATGGVNTRGGLSFANLRSTDTPTLMKLKADSRAGGLTGGNARTALVLDGANLTLTESALSSGVTVVRAGTTEKVIKGGLVTGTQTILGAWLGVPMTLNIGTLTFDMTNGASVQGSPAVEFDGGSLIQFNHASYFNTDASIGAVTVTSGSARIFSVTSGTISSYVSSPSQSLTIASLTRNSGNYGTFDFTSTYSNLYGQRASITGQADGVIGLWATNGNGTNLALYRTSGTFSTGGAVTAPSIDFPTYGTDSAYGFLPSIGTGPSVGSVTASDHIQITGSITAQPSVATKSLKLSGASVTLAMADANAVLTTEAILIGSSTGQTISVGRIQSGNAVTGELLIHVGANAVTIASTIQDGTVPTVLVRGFANNTLTLSGTNTYTGGTVLNGPSTSPLNISADSHLGAANCPLFFNGGQLSPQATISMSRNVTIGAGHAVITPAVATTLTLGGTVSGSGAIIHNGSGTIVLSGSNNSFQGGVRIASSGTIAVQHNNALGTGEIDFTSTGTLLFDTGVTSAFDPSSRISDRIGATYRFTNSCGYPITFASPFGTGNSVTSFIKAGTDDIILAADNTYGGTLYVAAGAVVLTHKGAIGTSAGTHTVTSGAALVLRNFSQTMDLSYSLGYRTFSLAGNGTATYPGALWCDSTTTAMTFNHILAVGTACTIGSSSSYLFSLTTNAVGGTAGITYRVDGSGGIKSTQVHSGTGRTITKTGVYTLELAPTASNTYTGLTTVSAGTLKATTETPATLSPIGTGGCTVSSGARLQTSTGTLQQGKLTIAGTLTVNSGVLRIGG